MPSTYSSNLKIELMSTGENSGTWGNITNTNLGTALEQAVVGYGAVSYASDANLTISITNSNAAQAARALVLNVTSALSLTATRELVVPTIEKQYIVQNNTTGSQSITVKTSAGTGITVPNGRKAHLYVDGTNVIQMFDFVDINGGTIDGTPIGGSSAAAGSFTTLGASGAATFNGSVTLGDAAADLIVFNGTVNSHLLFTDNTYDIGANGATRPRNLFLAGAATIGGNLSVGGTLTLTGGLILNGNVTVGDNASDTLTVNATITSNLIFTDNTYDIGASGATRPRNLFLAGNATIGGSQTLTGALTVDSTTDSSSTTTGSIQTDGGLGVAKNVYIGGTTVNQSNSASITHSLTSTGGGVNLTLSANTGAGPFSPQVLFSSSGTSKWAIGGGNIGSGGANDFGMYDYANAKLTYSVLAAGGSMLMNTNLLFNDNTYDIGASGASRPRNLFLGNNLAVGGNETITGYLGVGAAASSSNAINIASTNLAGSYQVGLQTALVGNSAATAGVFGIYTYPATAAAAFTTASVVGLYAENAVKGAGSTITNQYGVYITDQTRGANNFGLYSGVTAGTNKFNLYVGGSAANYLEGALTVNSGAVVFNESGGDNDFRVESDNNTHMLFVDAGTDTVNIGGTPPTYPGKLNVGGGGIFSNATSFDPDLADNGTILLGNINDGGGFSAPGIGWKNSGTGNTAAVVAAGNTLYLGTGDASTANSLTARLNLSHLESVFNEGGLDVDFRVESDTETYAFFVDGTNGYIGMGVANPNNIIDAYRANADCSPQFSSGFGTELYLNSGNNYASLILQESNVSRWRIGSVGGTSVGIYREGTGYYFNIDTSGNVVFNDLNRDADFRVASDTNTHALFVDAGNSKVGINWSVPSMALTIGATSATGAITNISQFSGIQINGNAANVSKTGIGYQDGGGGGAAIMFGRGGSYGTDISFFTNPASNASAGGMAERGYIGENGGFYWYGEAVFNESGGDADFRVESDNNTHMLFVDAGSDVVSIGTGTVPNWYNNDTLQSNTWAVTSLLGADQSGWSTGCYQDAYGYTAGWKFKGNYPATLYAQSGDHAFFVTASTRGTGNAITWREALRLSDGAAVFNEDSNDVDFRVESDTNTHALFVDAGNASTQIADKVVFQGEGNAGIVWARPIDVNYTSNNGPTSFTIRLTGASVGEYFAKIRVVGLCPYAASGYFTYEAEVVGYLVDGIGTVITSSENPNASMTFSSPTFAANQVNIAVNSNANTNYRYQVTAEIYPRGMAATTTTLTLSIV